MIIRKLARPASAAFLLILGAFACSGLPAQSENQQSEEVSAASTSVGKSCTTDANCAPTTFCDTSTYAPWTCHSKRPAGSYCFGANECASGICKNYVCAAPPTPPACKALGSSCAADTDCCPGSFCDNSNNDFGYGYGYGYGWSSSRCAAPQPNGSSCTANTQCASGNCDQYECKPIAAPTCSAVGSACTKAADCCAPAFCDTYSSYVGWKCTAPQPAGASCTSNAECKSGCCKDYACH